MNIIKNSIFFIFFLNFNTPLYSNSKLSEMFEMGYLSASYQTSLDVGLNYSGAPTTLHIDVSNNPEAIHDGNIPHIGHSFSEETLLHGYIADTFMNLILGKIKFVFRETTTPQAAPQAPANPLASMDLLDQKKGNNIHVGARRSSDEAGLVDSTISDDENQALNTENSAAPEIDPQEEITSHSDQMETVTNATAEDDEAIKPPSEAINLKPTLGLLLNIVSKTSSHFIIPFASGKGGDLNRGLMTIAFTSMPDTVPSSEWIQYPGKVLTGHMIVGIIQSTLLSKIKRTVDSQTTKSKGIYN